MAVVAQLLVTISAITRDLEQGLGEAQKKISGTAKAFDTAGKAMTGAGKALSVGVTLPLLIMGGTALKASMDFNQGMANIATLIPGNVKRVDELKETVKDLAVTTGKSTEDLSGGLYQVVSAFGDSADSAKILEINARAATAGLATTTDAINLTSAVTKGYGDTSAKAVQKVSDLAFQTVKLGQTDYPQLASSIGRVVPLASELGVSMEEMFGVMATGTGVTGTASEVSTQLRGVLQSLMAPTEDMTDLFTGMGYETGKAMLKSLGLQGTINKIVESANKTGTPLQKYIGSIEGQTIALALAGSQSDVFSQKLKEMGSVAGATDEAFREQTQGVNKFAFMLQTARNEIKNVQIELGEALAPVLLDVIGIVKPFIASLKGLVERFASLDEGTRKTIVTILGIVMAIGPLLVVLGTLASAISSIITFWGLLQPVMAVAGVLFSSLAVPIAIAIAAIAGLIAIGILVKKHWTEISKFFAVTVPAKFNQAIAWFKSVPDKIRAFMAKVPEIVGYIFGRALRILYDTVVGGFSRAYAYIVSIPGRISSALSKIPGIVSSFFTRAWQLGVKAVSNLVNRVTADVRKLPGEFSALGSRILSYVSALPGKLYAKAKSIAGSFWRGFKKGLGISSPSFVEMAFINMGEQALATVKDIKKLAPKVQSEMAGLVRPLSIAPTGALISEPVPRITPFEPTGGEQPAEPMVAEGVSIIIQNLSVREEADVERIADQLWRLQQRRLRGIGG